MGRVCFLIPFSSDLGLTAITLRMKRTKEQFDDRIVECRYDFPTSTWRFMRMRDDKADGNHRDVVEKVVRTIVEPVYEKDVRRFSSNHQSHRSDSSHSPLFAADRPMSDRPHAMESPRTSSSAGWTCCLQQRGHSTSAATI